MSMSLGHASQVLMGPKLMAVVTLILELQDAGGPFSWSLGTGLGDARAFRMSSYSLKSWTEEGTSLILPSDHRSWWGLSP